MVNVGYLKMDEVPGIPRLAQTPAVHDLCAARHHAGRARCRDARPGQPAHLMLLHEAATRALADGDACVAPTWPSDVHGDSRGALLGRRLELWLRRQSHLHRHLGR